MFEINNLTARAGELSILKGLNLTIPTGEVHGIMGPNGSGKSTLARVISGDPSYQVDTGSVVYNGLNLLDLPPHERARSGVFLAFQYPMDIPGVTIGNFLRTASNAVREQEISAMEFYGTLQDRLKELQLDPFWGNRYVNEGFSGGEKKRNEILQMLVLQPSLCILDETDSGLDVDALKIVAEGVNKMRSPERTMLIVTHYERLLEYIQPDRCHIMMDGQIIHSEPGKSLADRIDKEGYEWLRTGNAA
jgi:Fe-S cluster assembly ATP-binding protein